MTAQGNLNVLGLTLVGSLFLTGCTQNPDNRPKPTGNNSSAETRTTGVKAMSDGEIQQAMFGAGCFWGVEATFRKINGVVDTAVGYSGGTMSNPTYKDVCADRTGHAEVVLVQYDPAVVSYDKLLDVFWNAHNPTQVNRQGPDYGSQYRSAVFFFTPEQQAVAEASKQELAQSGKYDKSIATQIAPAGPFYRAEEYHQQYLAKHGRDTCASH